MSNSANIISKTFAAAGAGAALFLKQGQSLRYTAVGNTDFAGVADLERSEDGGKSWQSILSETAVDDTGVSGTVTETDPAGAIYRWRVETYDEGSDDLVTTLAQSLPATKTIFFNAGMRAGATAGWLVAGDTAAATLPKNKTDATLIVPLPGLDPDDFIVGAQAVGSLQADTSKPSTLDVSIRKVTSAAAGGTDAEIAAIDQLEVEVDTKLTSANAGVANLSEKVVEGVSYYALITASTFDDDASTQEIEGILLSIAEA